MSDRRKDTPSQTLDATKQRAALPALIACLAAESDADLWGRYGKAATLVRRLALIEWDIEVQWRAEGITVNSYRERDELREIIWREHPDVAKELGVPRQTAHRRVQKGPEQASN